MRGVEHLCVTGRWPSSVDIDDFHRIAQKEIWLQQVLAGMEQEFDLITRRLKEAAELETYWSGTVGRVRQDNSRNGYKGNGNR